MGISINDGGWKKLVSNLQGFRNKKVTIGIHKGKQSKKRSKGNVVDGELPLATVAAFHEYGTSRMPQRAFMRGTVEKHIGEIKSFSADSIKECIETGKSADEILAKHGEQIAEWMKEEILNGDFAPLAPSTTARKGSDKPLIDTGTLLNGIDYKIESKE